jgi:hypothetical protein
MFKKSIATALLLVVACFSGVLPSMFNLPSEQVVAASSTLKVPGGTPLTLKLINEVSSESAVPGSSVEFRVVGDVKVGSTVVIKNGSLGSAQITAIERNGILGQEGSVTISDFHVPAVDGTRVPLAATLSHRGKDKQILSAVGTLLCLFPVLIKGGHGVIPAGTEKTVYTSVDVSITP